jgi:predicted dehydrogenase
MKVGIAGVGFMGWIHWLAYSRLSNAEVVAICTRSEKKRSGDWTDIKGNFGPAGEQVDLSAVKCYESVDEMLADPTIDMVDICLPPNMHASVTKAALAAGKHVLCEKPMALNTDDCVEMVKVAEQAGRQLLIAQVLPFFPEYAFALEAIQSERYGKLIGGSFKRVISDPSQSWIPDFFDPQTVGGPLIDLHVHDAHLIRILFGMPTAVHSQGRVRGETVEYCNTLFSFEDSSLVVSACSGVIGQQGRPFTHGFEIHFERATLHFELAVIGDGVSIMPLTVLNEDGSVETPDLGEVDDITAFEREISEAFESIRSGRPSALLSGELARDAIILCMKQDESVKTSARVEV